MPPTTSELVPVSEEHKVLDSTKLTTFKTCERRAWYEHILGWRPEGTSHDLIFGEAFHQSLEYIYDRWIYRQNTTGEQAYNKSDIEEAYQIFLNAYRQQFGPETDVEQVKKNPANAYLMLQQYIDKYRTIDTFKVLYTEISGSVMLAEGKSIYFRLDTVIEENGKPKILEHKTSGWSTSLWMQQWDLSMQIGVGLHVLQSIWDTEHPEVIVNGLFFRGLPRMKKDGTPYASDKGNELLRVPVIKSRNSMQDWFVETNRWFSRWQEEEEIFYTQDSIDNPVMLSFPKNEKGCMAYNRACPFIEFCKAYPNPIKRCTEVPIGYEKRLWDPRRQDKVYKGTEKEVQV